jgi:hypothetical protein
MRGLLRPSVGAGFAWRLGHYERCALRLGFEARHLQRRQRGRRKQQETKVNHVISGPGVILISGARSTNKR